MGLIREPKGVDFTVASKPWSAKELADFRKLMTELKAAKKPVRKTKLKGKKAAYGIFGPGVFTLNPAHVITTRCFAMHMGHGAKLNTLSEL